MLSYPPVYVLYIVLDVGVLAGCFKIFWHHLVAVDNVDVVSGIPKIQGTIPKPDGRNTELTLLFYSFTVDLHECDE